MNSRTGDASRAWTIGSMVVAIIACVVAYQFHLTAEHEESRRVRADELRAAEAKMRQAAEARAEAAETRARDAEYRALAAEAENRSRSLSVASAATQTSHQNSVDAAARRDAAELARIDRLQAECEGFRRAGPGPISSVFAQQACGAYYEAVKRRQYYEANKRR